MDKDSPLLWVVATLQPCAYSKVGSAGILDGTEVGIENVSSRLLVEADRLILCCWGCSGCFLSLQAPSLLAFTALTSGCDPAGKAATAMKLKLIGPASAKWIRQAGLVVQA